MQNAPIDETTEEPNPNDQDDQAAVLVTDSEPQSENQPDNDGETVEE